MTGKAGAVCKGLCVAAGLLALAAAAGGCDANEINRFNRRVYQQKPADYGDMPLGPRFDTRAKIARLRNESLRGKMVLWMDLRDEYLKAWVDQGDIGTDVRVIKNQRDVLKAVIQDLATQLAGQPLGD